MAEYNWHGLLGSITTVVAFVAFVAIVLWAYSSRRKAAFDEAANAPFALPDDLEQCRAGAATTAAGPSQGGRSAPSGGSAAASAASVGAHQ